MKMPMIFVLVMLAVNFGISWFNARSVGAIWRESKAIGGWPRVTAWAGAIMSSTGFTWCYLITAFLIAGDKLPARYVQLTMEFGYLLIVLSALGSGAVIWVDSMIVAWTKHGTASVAIAGWNTAAMAENTVEAAKTLPAILKDIFASDGDSDGEGVVLAYALRIVALVALSGILTTAAIVRSTMRKKALAAMSAAAESSPAVPSVDRWLSRQR